MSLRVRAPLPPGEVRRGPGGQAIPQMDDGYTSRLVKLVPAEAIGPFPFLLESAKQINFGDGGARYPVYLVAWVLLIIVIVLRARATSEPGRGAQWGAVLISAVAFFIWAHVLGGDFGFEMLFKNQAAGVGTDGISRTTAAVGSTTSAEQFRTFAANLSLTAWTIIAPAVYRGEDEPN